MNIHRLRTFLGSPAAWLVGIAVFATALVLGYREIVSPDVGFYLAIGRNITEQGHVPRVEALTYSVAGHAIPYAPWLYCLSLWWADQAGGTRALVLQNLLVTLLALALLAWRCRRRNGRLTGSCAVLLLLFCLASSWEIRPHAWSWLFLSGIMLALEEYARGSRRALWALPPIMALWVNIHSLFVLGLIAIGIHTVGRGLRERRLDPSLLAAGLAAGLACFLTPYAATVATYPLTQFGVLVESPIKSAIYGTREFLSPFRLQFYTETGRLVWYQPMLFTHLFAVVAAAGWFLRARHRRVEEWLLFGAFAAIFCQALKNFGYFAVIATPAAAAGWSWLADRALGPAGGRRRRLVVGAATVGLVAGCGILIVHVINGYYYGQQRAPDRLGHRFSEQVLPVRACEFLRTVPAPGRILNNWDNGGYLAFATRRPVFVYGWNEVHGPEFYRDYLRFKDPRQMPAQLAAWHQDLALVPHNELPQWFAVLAARPDWRCVYVDDVSAVFFHQSYAPQTPPWRGPGAETGRPADEDAILRQAAARHMPSLLDSLAHPHYEPRRELRRTALALLTRNPQEAIRAGLEGLHRSTFPAPELLLNMGHAYYALRERERALVCYAAALRDLDDDVARSRLRAAERRAP